jgi:hypothetical protein
MDVLLAPQGVWVSHVELIADAHLTPDEVEAAAAPVSGDATLTFTSLGYECMLDVIDPSLTQSVSGSIVAVCSFLIDCHPSVCVIGACASRAVSGRGIVLDSCGR